MHELRHRETVILADDFAALIDWYQRALGFAVVQRFDEGFHYCNMESPSGIKIGIAPAAEMGVGPAERAKNTVVIQFEVDDVRAFLAHVEAEGGKVTGGPSHSPKDDFWFGSFADLEGNPFWVVDGNCP